MYYPVERQPCKCFNPRTREGCDASEDGLVSGVSLVSIHAPARGATVLMICQGKSNSYLGVFENCPKRSSLKNHS